MLGMRALAAELGSLLKPSESSNRDKQPQQHKEEMAPKQDDPAQSGEQKVDTRYNLKAPSLDAGGPCMSCCLCWCDVSMPSQPVRRCLLLQAPAWLSCPEQVLWWPASLWLKLLYIHECTLPAGCLRDAMPPCLPAQAAMSAFSSLAPAAAQT